MTKKAACDEEKKFNNKECAKGYFDDGVVYEWVNGITPRHIHFEVKTTSTGAKLETCGVHFYNMKDDASNKVLESTYKDKWVTGPKGPTGKVRVPN